MVAPGSWHEFVAQHAVYKGEISHPGSRAHVTVHGRSEDDARVIFESLYGFVCVHHPDADNMDSDDDDDTIDGQFHGPDAFGAATAAIPFEVVRCVAYSNDRAVQEWQL